MPRDRRQTPTRAGRALLIALAAGYVLVLVGLPLANVYGQAFSRGASAFLGGLAAPEAIHAAKLTLLVLAIVVPANTAFGLAAAWVIARRRSVASRIDRLVADLPLAVSPTVVGLLAVLAWSPNVGLLAPLVRGTGIRILFAWPGLVLATIVVTLPYVVREVLPALYQLEKAEEEAASVLGATRWQAFWQVVFPAIRASVLYGVILCTARAAGEFGAVSVVSGHVRGETNTIPLQVEILYNEYNFSGAFAVASILTIVALLTLLAKKLIEMRIRTHKT